MLNPVPTSYIYDPPTDPWINIVHEEADFVIVDKPSGLLSVPGKDPALADSLQRRAEAHWPTAGMIHRLDKDTSGVMVLALNKRAHAKIAMQFEKRTAQKSYVARVWGQLEGEQGLVDLPIAVDWENKPRQRIDFDRGREARTEWKVLAREPTATRVKLHPLTGRTHQLRLHMMTLGHPVLGDQFYATGDAFAAADRLQLHAEELSFLHPTTGEPVNFVIPAPF
jgi:tRNA pseudouridine32 synthase / 23S rRNA pseudouridine746 synthase